MAGVRFISGTHHLSTRGAARVPFPAVDWLARACILIPALDAAQTLGDVVDGLTRAIPECEIIVVDDGSSDGTADVARAHGCTVIPSGTPGVNRGKGAALQAGLREAAARGHTVALSIDADGQHPPDEARRVLLANAREGALVLGIRDLEGARAPRANRFSNGISNFFLSRFAGRPLRDTQCGLRRYPVRETLALPARAEGYDFEAEVLLNAIWSGLDVTEVPIRVLYPPDRRTHFRIRRDVRRIIFTVVGTVADHRRRR